MHSSSESQTNIADAGQSSLRGTLIAGERPVFENVIIANHLVCFARLKVLSAVTEWSLSSLSLNWIEMAASIKGRLYDLLNSYEQ